jgi:hypothetical protein
MITTTRPAVAGAASYGAPPVPPPNVTFGNRPETPWMSPQTVELITNGGFESGGLGWFAYDQPGSAGNWFLVGGPGSGPLSGLPYPAPAQGALQAMTDMTGPGSHILYQDVTIPALATATLNLVLWYNNSSVVFETPPTLDFNAGPNQQFRIDIMNPAAPLDDVGAGVLQSVFATSAVSPLTLGYTLITANLNAFAGQTIRLRFAEVDNQLWFNVGVDAISIQAEELTPVHPATWGSLKGRYR